MGNEVMNFLGFGEEEYEDEYGEADYFYPSFESAGLLQGGGQGLGSSYSFYNPYGNYHPARDDKYVYLETEHCELKILRK